MRRILCVLTALVLGLAVPGPVCAQQVFMAKHGRGRAQQGMAIHGNWIFSCEDGGKVNLYDFRKRDGVPVTSFTLASAQKDNHANNAEFGIEKKAGASFPLLYISVGKVGCPIEWTCFVESVTRQGNTFTSELVQTILLDNCHGWEDAGYTPIFGSPSFLIDRDRRFLWVFSAIKRTTPAVTKDFSENLYVATKFRIPALSEGSVVHLRLKDILGQVTFPYDIGFTQAGCVRDGKIYYCFGVGNRSDDRPAGLRVYDTDTGAITASFDLKETVLQEPEDIHVRGKKIYLNANTPSKSGIDPLIYTIPLPRHLQ